MACKVSAIVVGGGNGGGQIAVVVRPVVGKSCGLYAMKGMVWKKEGTERNERKESKK